MDRLRADLALGRVEDEDGNEHNVTVAVLIAPWGVAWQSRAAWGVGPGSALAGARVLDLLRDDVNEQWPQADIDWSVIDQIMTDIEDGN